MGSQLKRKFREKYPEWAKEIDAARAVLTKKNDSRVQNDGHYRRKYNLEPEDVARLFESQQGQCAGCLSMLFLGKDTHVDHCHTTKIVRGLLCSGCNLALGAMKDSIQTLQRLERYLASSRMKGARQ